MKRLAIHQAKTTVLAWALCLVLASPQTRAIDNPDLARLVRDYQSAYPNLDIAPLNASYVENLRNIRADDARMRQLEYFQAVAKQLQNIDASALVDEDRYIREHLAYIVELNLQRLALENSYIEAAGQGDIPANGIYNVAMGQEWYRHFVRRWLSVETTPEELVEFGSREIAKVQQQIREVQVLTGYEDDDDGFYQHLANESFLLRSADAITAAYREREAIVKTNLGQLFLQNDTPLITIRPYLVSDKDTPPAGVVITPEEEIIFQYNFFEQQHNVRGMDFIYLHEAVPGHAYFYQYLPDPADENALPVTRWSYAALGEGWAAYCEELGYELGLYQTPYDLLGKLEFDLVRSVRVVMDVGLNYYGWTNQQALEFWRSNIKGQDAIAQREIDRMLRWPVQVLTYKVGANKIMALKTLAQEKLGQQFDVKEFHHQILGYSAVPLFLLEKRVTAYITNKLGDK